MSQDQELSEAEKMRLKRLARLGGPSTPSPSPGPSSTPSSEQPTSSSPAATPRAPPSASSRLLSTPLPAAASSSTTPPPPQTSASSSKAPATKSSPMPAPTPKLALKRHASPPSRKEEAKPRVASAATSQPVVPKQKYEDWETDKVGEVFSVTLERKKAEASDWKLCWLKGLQQEIEEEEPDRAKPLQTTIDLRDRLLIARLSLDPADMANSDDADVLTILAGLPDQETIFEYLAGCWKRLGAANREMTRLGYSKEEKARWTESATLLKELIMSYCGMTLEDPSMFPQPADKPTGPAEFLPILLSLSPSASTGAGDPLTASSSTALQPNLATPSPLSPSDLLPFLHDLAAGFAGQDLSNAITPTLSLFFQRWFSITPTPDLLGEDWQRYIGAVGILVQVKAIAALFPSLPIWVAPGVQAAKLEWQSLLGPLTRLSVFPREFPEIWKMYFSNPTDRKKEDIDANKSNLRHALGALHTSLFNIYNSVVRSSPEAREGILDFFALVIKLNEKRAGMRVDPRTVSSDGYMANLQVILLKLFEPVMDVQFSKIDKVDAEYYKHTKLLDVTEETKIRANKEEADAYYGKPGDSSMDVDAAQPNFISHLFFLTNAFQHLGVVKTISTRIRAEKNISEMEKDLKRAEAARPSWAGNPAMEAQGEAQIKKIKADIATLHASIHAYDTQLLDPAMVRLNVSFLGFLMTWLVRLVDPTHRHPATPINLPLPADAPVEFKMLPEYLLDNITEYFDFLSRYEPDAIDDIDKDTIITFCVVFLSPGYINNPFLKAKLVSIISHGLYPVGYWRKGTMFDRLGVQPLATKHLMPMLIRFFIDAESTGGHTQFWDKFNFRRDISHIIRTLWANPLHREAFVQARHDDFDQFIKFINMLMSDTTFHLEESLADLQKIGAIQTQQADTAAWNALPQTERDDLQSQLQQAESQAPFHTIMGLDHVELIKEFTKTTREPFVTEEIVDRLAATLDGNLVDLVGPKMQELRVSDPDRFSFKPKKLLAGLAQIYLNLSIEADFVRAVANDGRSYSKDLFERFARILRHRAIMTEQEVEEVVRFTEKVEQMKATIDIEDEREIPEEFLDPLLSTLMKDPVILPVSRVTIDRGTIRTVLLGGDKDPFNNVPLKYEDCLPDVELKAKIDAWIAEGKKDSENAAVMEVDK